MSWRIQVPQKCLESIMNGTKRIDVRPVRGMWKKISPNSTIWYENGNQHIQKKVKRVKHYSSIHSLLEHEDLELIEDLQLTNPAQYKGFLLEKHKLKPSYAVAAIHIN